VIVDPVPRNRRPSYQRRPLAGIARPYSSQAAARAGKVPSAATCVPGSGSSIAPRAAGPATFSFPLLAATRFQPSLTEIRSRAREERVSRAFDSGYVLPCRPLTSVR